jgi:hypothetical protein
MFKNYLITNRRVKSKDTFLFQLLHLLETVCPSKNFQFLVYFLQQKNNEKLQKYNCTIFALHKKNSMFFSLLNQTKYFQIFSTTSIVLTTVTCSFFGIPFVSSFLSTSGFLSFISFFPFCHLWSLFLKSSSVSHFFRSSGEYFSVVEIYPRLALFTLPGWPFHYLVSLVTGELLEGNSRSFMIQHLSDSLCLGVSRWCAVFSCHYRA